MVKHAIFISLTVFSILLHSFAFCVEIDRSLPMMLEKQMSNQFDAGWNCFYITDANGDGNDDLLIDKHVGIIFMEILRGQFQHLDEGQYVTNGCISYIHDIDGDRIPEYFIRRFTDEGIHISCYRWSPDNRKMTLLYERPPLLKPTGREKAIGTGTAGINCCHDLDGDGRMEAYLLVYPYMSGPYPRTLIALDALSGDILHKFELGPVLSECLLFEDTSLGNRLIVSTSSPQNHACWNGTSDTLSYVFCLTPTLEEDWKKIVTVNGGYCTVAVGDINRDGNDEMVLCRSYGDEKATIDFTGDDWSVAILDPAKGIITQSRPLHTGTHTPILADLFGDSTLEIVFCGDNRILYILDGDLNVVYESKDRDSEMLHLVKDLDLDGYREIVCSGEGLLMVRDSRGVLKAEMPWNSTINEKTFRKVETAEIAERLYLATMNDGCVMFYRYASSPLSTRLPGMLIELQKSPFGAVVLVLLGMGIGASAIFLAGFRHKKENSDDVSFACGEAGEELLRAMTAYGHGGSSIKVINRLRFYLVNRGRTVENTGNQAETFDGLARAFNGSVLSELHLITSLAGKAGVAKSCRQEMIRCAGLASRSLSGIMASSSIMLEGAGSNAETARQSLDAIEKCVSVIRLHLRNMYRCQLVDAIIRVLSRGAEELETRGIRPVIDFSGTADQSAFVSNTVLEKVMENLLTNAVRAMEKSAQPEFGISITVEGDYHLVDIRDTGCGIAEDEREKVFDRQYTTKVEGGFGLYYAREELAKFGAKIFIKESTPGKGTIVRIVLRRS